MRTIKFRAWAYPNKKMYYDIRIGSPFPETVPSVWTADKSWVELWGSNEEGVIMQFTGLHDAKGVEIWEGDILEYVVKGKTADGTPWKDILTKPIRETVGFEDGRFTGYIGKSNEYVVIGNIYENPELIHPIT